MTLHGHTFSYADSGSGPVLLFIHGLLGSQRQWAHLVDRARRRPPGHRARPVRPRGVRQADGRLLARRARRDAARPARPARHRAGDPRRPLARRRHRHGVLLPVPRARRPARARRQRRPRPRGEPAPALGDAAGRGVRAPGHRLGLGARPDRLGRPGARRRRAAPGPRRPRGVGTASPRSATPTPGARSSPRPARSSTPGARASPRTTTCPRRRRSRPSSCGAPATG